MLNDTYIAYVHQQLAGAARPDRHSHHRAEIELMRRAASPARRLARMLGHGMLLVAERLLVYGGERALLRITAPIPPVVELRPGAASYSQN